LNADRRKALAGQLRAQLVRVMDDDDALLNFVYKFALGHAIGFLCGHMPKEVRVAVLAQVQLEGELQDVQDAQDAKEGLHS
jgi:hypothetical protein